MLGITGYLHPFESVLNQNKENLLVGWITQFLIGVSRDLKGLTTESLVVMKNNQIGRLILFHETNQFEGLD